MTKLNIYLLLFLFFTISPTIAFAQSVTFIVTDVNDDSNARDSNPGDGICSDNNSRCTLRAAIDEANASSGKDVTIVIPGTLPGSVTGNFTLARVAPNDPLNTYENDNAFGDLDINGTFNSLRLQGTGTPGPSISIAPNDRIIDIVSGGDVIVERIQFTGGTARDGRNGNPDDSNTFGINGEDGEDGGGMRIGEGMNVEMDQVTFNGNTTQSGGNGVAPASNIALIDGGNGGNGGNGGAIYISANASVRISRATFTQNGTGDGGSPASGQSNGDPAKGGRGGNGGNGAAIYNAGSLELNSSTIAFNNGGSPTSGAAGVNGGATGEAGEGGSGGGIAQARFIDGTEVIEGTTTLLNSIVAGNNAGDDTQNGKQPGTDLYDGDAGRRFTSRGFNLIGSRNAANAFRKKTGDEVGRGRTGINPQLNSLNRNDDAAVPTLQPRSNSPAVDAGTTLSMSDYDARGFVRPNDGGQADKGAHERNSTPAPVDLIISSVNASGDESITLTNNGAYAVQADDHVLVAFGDDYNNGGTSCLSINLYGEIEPGASFTIGAMNVSPKQQPIDLDVVGPNCGSGTDNLLADMVGAVGLYTGGASSLQGFVFNSNQAVRLDLFEYDNSAAIGSSSLGQSYFHNVEESDHSVAVFPNPTEGITQIQFTATETGRYQINILDMNAKVLKSATYTSDDTTSKHSIEMDLNDLVSGVYLIQITSESGHQMSQFVRR